MIKKPLRGAVVLRGCVGTCTFAVNKLVLMARYFPHNNQ